MIAASGGFVFIMLRVLMTGQITTVSKGWQSSSSVYTFSQHPVAFVVFFLLYAALALGLVWVTLLVARRAIKGTRPA